MIEGNIKIEPLRHWKGAIPDVLRDVLDGKSASTPSASDLTTQA
jgi:hypothetical protein